MYGLIVLVLFFVFGIPIAKALAERLSREISAGPTRPDAELRRELEITQSLLADTQTRLAAMEQRLDFYEKLIEERRPPRLPRGADTDTPPQ